MADFFPSEQRPQFAEDPVNIGTAINQDQPAQSYAVQEPQDMDNAVASAQVKPAEPMVDQSPALPNLAGLSVSQPIIDSVSSAH